MKIIRDNYTMLLIASSVLLLLITNAVLGVVLSGQSQRAMKILIQSRMLDIANTSAAMLKGDELKDLTAEDKDTEPYQRALKTLAVFQENINLEYIYCIQPPKDGVFLFSVDPTVEDPGEFGTPIVTTEALKLAAQGTAAVDEEPYSDSWGRFYSAYSPVFDSDGQVAAIVAVDFSAAWYDTEIAKQERTIIICVTASLAMCIVLVLLATAQMRRRIRVMTGDMAELSRDVDDLTREFSVTSAEESDDKDDGSLGDLGERILRVKEMLRRHVADMNSKANSMITALGSEYRSVYYIDLDKDEGICYQATEFPRSQIKVGDTFSFTEVNEHYMKNSVAESYRKTYREFMDIDHIRRELAKKRLITHVYLATQQGREMYEMVRIAGVRHPERRSDNIVHAVGLGFTDVDEETRRTLDRNAALSNALKAAETASLAKTAFLSNMSHEIRTPMNAIIGLNKLALASADLSDEVREQLKKIGVSADHLLSIINDILDVSRIESGRVVLKSSDFSLSAMLEQVNTIIGGQCRDKGLAYECEAKTGGDFYNGDEMKIRQVLINILGNAVKFTPPGGRVKLTITETAGFEQQTAVKFVIQDTGVGMSREFLPKLFDPFSQENTAVSNSYGSTGLGMTITKNFVELMKGAIEVESEPGKGTKFTVTLTLIKGHTAPMANERDALPEKKPEKTDLKGRCILVAEDMPVNAEIILAILEMGGMRGDHAENGKAALDKFTASPPGHYSAVLMDMRMPVMDGLAATKSIRAADHPQAKTIPIIALTANAFEEDIRLSLQAGVNAHLSKPVNPEEIYEVLAKLIKD